MDHRTVRVPGISPLTWPAAFPSCPLTTLVTKAVCPGYAPELGSGQWLVVEQLPAYAPDLNPG
jgi:hypothetical protein